MCSILRFEIMHKICQIFHNSRTTKKFQTDDAKKKRYLNKFDKLLHAAKSVPLTTSTNKIRKNKAK